MNVRTWVADGEVFLCAADVEAYTRDMAARARATGDGLLILGASGVEAIADSVHGWIALALDGGSTHQAGEVR